MVTTAESKIRILIADDHPMMLMGIRNLLLTQPYIEIVAEALDGQDALAKTKSLAPDIAVLDISMPIMGGLEVACALNKEMPNVKVIIISMYDETEYVQRFLKSGASGEVLKKNSPEELIDAIDAVNHGDAFFSPSIAQTILKHSQGNKTKSPHELTERETEIVVYICKGLGSKEIAEKMFVSVRTVAKYRELIAKKLDIHKVADLMRYAIQHKLI